MFKALKAFFVVGTNVGRSGSDGLKPASISNLITKREVDSRLWEEVQAKAAGDESQKIEAAKLLFRRQYDLPEESKELILRLANRAQPEAVRMAVARELCETEQIPSGLYIDVLRVLEQDTSEEVRTAVKTAHKRMEEIMKPFVESIQVVAKAQQDTLRRFVESIRLPQQDLLGGLREQLVAMQLNAKSVFEPLHKWVQINEEIIRMMQPVLPSYYPLRDLKVIERPPSIPARTYVAELSRKLQDCPAGQEFWKDYQHVCKEILTHTLVPPLLEPEEGSSTEDGRQQRDLIFHIPHDVGGFWEWIRFRHKSVAIIVECKNYSEPLEANQVTITSKYFGEKRLGLFGIIACRKGLTDSARNEQKRLWTDHSIMIVCLNDDDLLRMLELRETDDDPAKAVDRAIRQFLESF